MHTPAARTPVRTLATAASVLIAAVCAANLYGTWTAWNAHSVVVDHLADLPGVTDSDLYAADAAAGGLLIRVVSQITEWQTTPRTAHQQAPLA